MSFFFIQLGILRGRFLSALYYFTSRTVATGVSGGPTIAIADDDASFGHEQNFLIYAC